MESRNLESPVSPTPAAERKPSYGFEILPAENAEKNADELRYVFYMNPPDVRVISFKGGGSRVFVYTKFLEVAQRNGLLKSVEEVGGSSSGSIAAVFAALHYEDPLKRTEALNEITNCNRYDIFTDSTGSTVYQWLTAPLYIISKPLEWLSKAIGWVANKCNKILPGKIIGIPLAIISTIVGLASALTSPRFPAGIYNLATKGGVYHGDKVQEALRESIRKDTHAGLHAILSKMEKPERTRMIDHIIEIGLGKPKNGRLVLNPDITFTHLAELSALTGGKFKEYFCTAVKVSDNSLMVFNKHTAPNMPIHLATRLAITFPRYYQTRSWEGKDYIDGGAINNSPVKLASHRNVSEFKSKHGINDNMSRLNVRVEYPHEYKNHLWHKAPEKNWLQQKIHAIMRAIAVKFTGGIDVFATDAEVTQNIRDEFAQQTLQLPDFGVGQMAENVGAKKRAKVDAAIEELVHTYMQHHTHPDVKAVIRHYEKPADMPEDIRRKLLKYLRNPEVRSADIFPGQPEEALEMLRQQEIDKLTQLPSTTCQSSTNFIARALDSDIEQVNIRGWLHDNNDLTAPAAAALRAHPDELVGFNQQTDPVLPIDQAGFRYGN